ncbi:MAG TPA: YqaJ viral recombinase family protein [Steroidobacteraceae bacterium]|nr:YqaJ viral recombinase family protein [Steroidobacteraceae bacterium]
MKIIDCVQGSDAWLTARLGIPTASEFHRIVTPARGDLSKQARGYAYQLVAEALLREPCSTNIENMEWVARGRKLEPLAAQQYEFATDTETKPVGFITTDCGRLGCSPDRLIVGQRGVLEIKCVNPARHVGYWLDGVEDSYKPQVMGQVSIAEVEFCDLYAYHPALPPATIRTHRDEPYIDRLRAALREFLDLRDDMLKRAQASGFFDTMAEAA